MSRLSQPVQCVVLVSRHVHGQNCERTAWRGQHKSFAEVDVLFLSAPGQQLECGYFHCCICVVGAVSRSRNLLATAHESLTCPGPRFSSHEISHIRVGSSVHLRHTTDRERKIGARHEHRTQPDMSQGCWHRPLRRCLLGCSERKDVSCLH